MKSQMLKITVVVDNQAAPRLSAEHGLALWIEWEGQRILFDTGQGEALMVNARNLGIELAETDILVLSHGHYDHTGGLPAVLWRSREIDIYCHPGVTQPRYKIDMGGPRAIHMPNNSMAVLNKVHERRMHWVSAPLSLSATMGLTGPIERVTAYENTGDAFYLDPHGMRADALMDDLALWIVTPRGVVVVVGCCHAGLVNTLNQVRRLNNGLPLYAVIGGLHLQNADLQRIETTVTVLQDLALQRLIPCHCTGQEAVYRLHQALGDMVQPGMAGATYSF